MNRLIQDLLDVGRLDASQLAVELGPVSGGQVVSDVLETLRPLAAAASIELRNELPSLPDLCADRTRLLQVFENLIGNALKFTEPGGHVTIGGALRDDEAMFWVADTGRGIASPDLEHAFDRFWQADGADKRGAGLGLAIVKGIVEAHRGRVWVESRLGHGSVFSFTIPTMCEARASRVG